MLPGVDDLLRLFEVQHVGRSQHDDIDRGIRQHFVERRIPTRNLQAGRGVGRFTRRRTQHTHDGVTEPTDGLHMHRADEARTHHRSAKDRHRELLIKLSEDTAVPSTIN